MRLLPVLKSADWPGAHSGARVHHWLGTDDDPVAYLAYAWETDEGLVYVTQSGSDALGEDLGEVVKQAFANLNAAEIEFELAEADGSRLLVAVGQTYAAERILTERYMHRAHESLDAERIVVSVPRRGMLLATAFDCSAQARATMTNLHREAWVTAGEDRITDRLILLNQGAVVETLSMAADGSVEGWSAPSRSGTL